LVLAGVVALCGSGSGAVARPPRALLGCRFVWCCFMRSVKVSNSNPRRVLDAQWLKIRMYQRQRSAPALM